MKRILKSTISTVIALSLLVSCSSDKNDSSNAGDTTPPADTNNEQTVVEETTPTIQMWQWKGNEEVLKIETKDIKVLADLAERTGVNIEWINPMDASSEFQAMMTSGQDMPDALMYKYTPQDTVGYATNGRIIDISMYLDEHLPNFKALLESNPTLEKQVTSPDGNIYYLPWITQGKYYYEGLMLREDWVDATGLSVPTTNEELYQLLKAQKELFDKGELPNAGENYYGLSGYPTQLMKLAYGFNATDDFKITDDGKIVYGPTTDEYREAMSWFYKLYTEGLIDPDVLSFETDIYNQHHANNLTAGHIDGYGSFGTIENLNPNIKYVPVPYMKNSDGEIREYNSTTKRVAQPYGYAITQAAASDEATLFATLKVFNYIYSEEGQELLDWGIEGETFTGTGDDKQYTDLILNDPDFPPGVALSKYLKPDLGNTDLSTNLKLLDERGLDAYAMWADTNFEYAMEPTLWTTPEEREIISTYLTDIKTVKSEYQDKFMTGVLDPTNDAHWDEFQKALTGMQIEQLTDAYNNAYQRFIAR